MISDVFCVQSEIFICCQYEKNKLNDIAIIYGIAWNQNWLLVVKSIYFFRERYNNMTIFNNFYIKSSFGFLRKKDRSK